MANRAQRRQIMKAYRRSGMSKEQAKATANTYYMGEAFKEGQKARLNYEMIIRHPEFNKQKDEFKAWVLNHKDEVLTVCEVKDNGMQVRFAEDENEEKFWHNSLTLFPVASAKIKLDDGTEKTVVLDGVTEANDPSIMEKVNEALKEEE